MNWRTVGEQLVHERLEAEKRTARVLLGWLLVALIMLSWQYRG